VFSLILKSYLKIKNKKKFSIKIKKLNSQNYRNFYIFLNYHTQHRSGYNMTRPYLLNSKLWYFQKKKIFKLSFLWKKIEINTVNNIEYNKLNSKIKWFY
jgi:hypothetical protein